MVRQNIIWHVYSIHCLKGKQAWNFLKYFFFRNRILMVSRACNTRFFNIVPTVRCPLSVPWIPSSISPVSRLCSLSPVLCTLSHMICSLSPVHCTLSHMICSLCPVLCPLSHMTCSLSPILLSPPPSPLLSKYPTFIQRFCWLAMSWYCTCMSSEWLSLESGLMYVARSSYRLESYGLLKL